MAVAWVHEWDEHAGSPGKYVVPHEPQVLVVNCGSSSLKLACIEPRSGRTLEHGLAERLGSPEATVTLELASGSRREGIAELDHRSALQHMLAQVQTQQLVAFGHRVVHGGEAFRESVRVDSGALAVLDALSSLAPLHNPKNVLGIRESMRQFPELPHVAVFDTAFHQSMPAHAYLYAIPYSLYEQHRVRRYGFHGSSHRYVAARAAELLDKPLDALQVISAHLGNGCSACAVRGGKSVDTTMGLSPLEGLVMGTRSGDVDPNLHAFLAEHTGSTLEEIMHLLNHQSGLLGLSGVSNDMRHLLELEAQGHARSRLAVQVFCYRLAKAILGLCASLERLDALIFTGGIGENAARVRELTLLHLSLLGAGVDARLNAEHGRSSGGRITRSESRLLALVVPTHEELVIAREALSQSNLQMES